MLNIFPCLALLSLKLMIEMNICDRFEKAKVITDKIAVKGLNLRVVINN